MKSKYILITSARNEEALIENTIKCVVSQSIKPIQWLIVSDASTDRTDEIIKKYSEENNFIKYIRKEKENNRNFASKVYALNLAIAKIDFSNYDFIGILDADITFDEHYYENIIHEFDKDPKLGIAGGEFFDIIEGQKVRVMKSAQSVRGGVQFFRRECFDQIGEFTALENGGEDIIMEVTARKNGWEVKSFDDYMLDHHRVTGTGGWNIWSAKFKEGLIAYQVGYHPIFQISKSLYRMKERPILIGGLLTIAGFLWANVSSIKKKVSKDFIVFLRNEQLSRMKKLKF